MTTADIIDQLAAHDTLSSAPRGELEWLASHGIIRTLAEGAVLTPKGAQVEGMFVVLSGHVGIYIDRGAGMKKVMEWRAGDITGMLPYSRLVGPPGDSVALAPTVVLAIHRDTLREMIRECHEVTAILVHKMVDRARAFATSDLHDEKMVSLGKLSAGLAHELNNPAAAIERSAALLEDRLDDAERATLALGAQRLTAEQLAAIDTVRAACLAKGPQGVLSPIQQAEREDAISDWLDDNKLDSKVAGPLSETAVTIDALEKIAGAVEGACLDAVIRWVAAGCSVRGITSEIQDAAMRISGLVAAVKGFTHMDQGAAAEAVDLGLGLSNTVAVLRAKARGKGAAVTLDVEPDLPVVRGFVGELNQIWANLIDNALDAIAPSGHVDVSARHERRFVVVRVADNGPGIPGDVQSKMFEPFFTTKPVGKGTGLGLDIVRRLLGHNNAQIEVDSVPGRTVFSVSLPTAESDGKVGPL
jgi:signal transduction histidine kinase